MSFNPDEPRDAIGRWTDSMSDAIHGAASDKGKTSRDDVTHQEDEIRNLIEFPGHVQLKGLSENEANDLVDVVKDMTNDGTVKIPIGSVYVCGQEYNSMCYENNDAGAFYGFDFEKKTGQLFINPDRVHDTFTYEGVPTYQQKIDRVQGLLDNINDPDFVARERLSPHDVEYNRSNFTALLDSYRMSKLHNEPPLPDNAALLVKDNDERFKSIVYHEMGHMALKKEFFDSHPNVRGGEAAFDAYHKWRDTNIPIVNPNSEYGKTNSDEYFAEWYGQYKIGKATDIPKQVKFLIDRINL